jgi:hypothetical protein
LLPLLFLRLHTNATTANASAAHELLAEALMRVLNVTVL